MGPGAFRKVHARTRPRPIVKFSVNVPDTVAEAAKEAAAAEGVTPAEWTRRALLAALHPEVNAAPDETLNATRTDLERTRADLERTQAERDQIAAKLTAAETQIAVLTAEAQKDAGHIESLQSTIATIAAARPPALPETAGIGRRPWWMFWRPKS